MGVQNTARFEAMVTDFCVTGAELGGRRVERGVVADTLAERVAATAATVGRGQPGVGVSPLHS